MCVHCRSESCYAQTPETLCYEGIWYLVVRVIHEWRSEDAKCFFVETENGLTFELQYRNESDSWAIIQS